MEEPKLTPEQEARKQRCLTEFADEIGLSRYKRTPWRPRTEKEAIAPLTPSVCRCGTPETLEPWPAGDILDRFIAYRCTQCGRLVYVSKGSGCQMWYKREG